MAPLDGENANGEKEVHDEALARCTTQVEGLVLDEADGAGGEVSRRNQEISAATLWKSKDEMKREAEEKLRLEIEEKLRQEIEVKVKAEYAAKEAQLKEKHRVALEQQDAIRDLCVKFALEQASKKMQASTKQIMEAALNVTTEIFTKRIDSLWTMLHAAVPLIYKARMSRISPGYEEDFQATQEEFIRLVKQDTGTSVADIEQAVNEALSTHSTRQDIDIDKDAVQRILKKKGVDLGFDPVPKLSSWYSPL